MTKTVHGYITDPVLLLSRTCVSSGSHSFGHNAVIINLLVVIARPTFCDGVWPGYKATAGDAYCTHAHGETAHTHIYMDVYCK